MREQLLLINLRQVDRGVIVTTIWAVTPDLIGGLRLTRTEIIAGMPALRHRLGELAAAIVGSDTLAAAAA